MDVRDEANRTRLAAADTELTDRRDDLQDQLDAMDPDPYDPAYLRLLDDLATVEEQLRAVDTLQGILEDPDRHLLVFDLPEGKRPEAAVAIGDVDTADHVGVFTPGLTSTVEGMGGYVDDMNDLRDATLDELAATATSTAPSRPSCGSTTRLRSGARPFRRLGRAVGLREDGGAALADFYRGLNSSRATDPDLTALGHSYGSTTTGYGLQHEGTGVDRAVFFGSPGIGRAT